MPTFAQLIVFYSPSITLGAKCDNLCVARAVGPHVHKILRFVYVGQLSVIEHHVRTTYALYDTISFEI